VRKETILTLRRIKGEMEQSGCRAGYYSYTYYRAKHRKVIV